MTVLSSSPLPPNTQTLGLLCCNTESASATLLYSFLLLMANFVCQLDWTNGAQIAGKTISRCVCEDVSGRFAFGSVD